MSDCVHVCVCVCVCVWVCVTNVIHFCVEKCRESFNIGSGIWEIKLFAYIM